MAQSKLVEIKNAHWQVGVLPSTGGSLAFGRIKHGEHWVDFMRPTPEDHYDKASDCASFPLIPWANRLGKAQFRFNGTDYHLHSTTPDGTAIHGVARHYVWQVEETDAAKVVLSFHSADHADINFPFHFSARLEYAVEGKNFTILTTLKNEDKHAMPGGFGHHPYFERTLGKASETVSLEIPCTDYFELTDNMASAAPKPIPSNLDYRHLRVLGNEPLDASLTCRQHGQPIRFVYGAEKKEIRLYSDAIFHCIDLYTPQDQPFFAVEPVTNARDGFNLYAHGIPDSGVFVLEPGEQRQGAIRFEV